VRPNFSSVVVAVRERSGRVAIPLAQLHGYDGQVTRSPGHAPIEVEPGRWTPTFDAGRCANCGSQTRIESPLYCSELCLETAKAIRYVRSKIAEGTADRPDIAEAIEMKMASILGGGYPTKARQVPTAVRRAAFERDGNTCQLCGAQATEIDHVAGSSNDPANLRALCKPCNMRLAQAQFVPAGPEDRKVAARIRLRIQASAPARLCDDHVNWNELWRRLKGQALAAIAHR